MATIVEVPVVEALAVALSRLKHGFESRWGHHFDFIDV
jgi:hypothetical protein